MPTAVPITDWPIEHVNVVNLLLDEHNTRLDSDVHSQDAIIRELFESEDAFAIVRSIADRGYFTNDLPIVTNEDVTYTVLEGNRRTAALKAILNPRLVYQYQPRIEKLFDGRDLAPLEKIQVMVAPTRDDALQLLAAIHTTQSRKKWDPLRQAQFFKAQHDAGKSLQEL